MADIKLPDWAKSIKVWTITMVGITATGAAGMMVRPGIEWVATYDLRKEVAANKLKSFSDMQEIKLRLTSIEKKLDGRDTEIIALALEAWDKKQARIARNNP